jgi:ubiquinone/menaquinone biosynthesis C-methylase UbiE
MGDSDRGQVTATAAEIYDSFFVPALFGQWTGVVLDAADVHPGHSVLDVGCGTGVLSVAAAERVGASGRVAGVDPNEGMLDVARRTEAPVEWKVGMAEELPYPDGSFDRVVSQFALMFTDPDRALAEAGRVTRADGRIAFAVWDRFEHNVGYARLADLIERLFGAAAARSLRAPFQLGDPATLTDVASHGITDPQVVEHRGTARFESLDAWLHTEIRGWTLADEIDDAGYEALLSAAARELADLASPRGVEFEVSALIVSGPPRER